MDACPIALPSPLLLATETERDPSSLLVFPYDLESSTACVFSDDLLRSPQRPAPPHPSVMAASLELPDVPPLKHSDEKLLEMFFHVDGDFVQTPPPPTAEQLQQLQQQSPSPSPPPTGPLFTPTSTQGSKGRGRLDPPTPDVATVNNNNNDDDIDNNKRKLTQPSKPTIKRPRTFKRRGLYSPQSSPSSPSSPPTPADLGHLVPLAPSVPAPTIAYSPPYYPVVPAGWPSLGAPFMPMFLQQPPLVPAPATPAPMLPISPPSSTSSVSPAPNEAAAADALRPNVPLLQSAKADTARRPSVADSTTTSTADDNNVSPPPCDDKRQLRLMKNRKAAQDSRKRARDYVGQLEREAQLYEAEKAHLTARVAELERENGELKRKVEQLHETIELFRASVSPMISGFGGNTIRTFSSLFGLSMTWFMPSWLTGISDIHAAAVSRFGASFYNGPKLPSYVLMHSAARHPAAVRAAPSASIIASANLMATTLPPAPSQNSIEGQLWTRSSDASGDDAKPTLSVALADPATTCSNNVWIPPALSQQCLTPSANTSY
ncbi:hypothetical protein RI367_006618 [Sorochytrium milnesiophthora]